MGDLGQLIFYVAITLLSLFVAAPLLLNTVSLFGVQKRFAQVMVEEKIIQVEEVKRIQPKKQIAGVVITAVFIGALVALCLKNSYGFFCFGGGLLCGLLKYRKVVQFNSLTVQRFQATYRDSYDTAKLNQYVNRTF